MKHDYANIRLIYVNMQRHILVFEKWMVNLTCIPFTKGFFVPSLVKIGPVLAHLSWKLKWAFLVACSQSIQQFTFSSSSQDENWTTESISTKLGTEHPMVNDYDLYQGGGGDNNDTTKIHWVNLRIFISRTTWPISTKFGTRHPWFKGIQVCQMMGHAFSKGDNSEIAKMYWRNLKIVFSRTA